MSNQTARLHHQATPAPVLAALACTSCKALLYIDDPMEKFTRYRKIACPRCGQPHRMDLYFMGERDCFDLVPVAKPQAISPLEDDD